MNREYVPETNVIVKDYDSSIYVEFKKGTHYSLWMGRNDKLWRRFRKMVLERDNYTCQNCGKTNKETILQIHHIKPVKDYPNLFYTLNNVITLCVNCHKNIHKKDNNSLTKWKKKK